MIGIRIFSTRQGQVHRSLIGAIMLMGCASALLPPAAAMGDIIGTGGRISLVVGFRAADGPIPSAAEQLYYCSIMDHCSRFIWQQTDGQHWLGDVQFIWEEEILEDSPCADVYWHRSDDWARVAVYGWCGFRVLMFEEVYDGFVQPAENLGWILSHELGHYIFKISDEYVSWEDDGEWKAANICVDVADSSCAMAERYVAHWCDDCNHLHTNPDWPGLQNPRDPDYRCWKRAKERNANLKHDDSDCNAANYPPDSDPPESVVCTFIDPANIINDAVLLLDRSGSMSYTNPHGIPAITFAKDAALLFYNKTKPGHFSGIVAFNELSPWAVSYGAFAGEVLGLVVPAAGQTDVAGAILEAAVAIDTQGNGGNRNILLFSDGVDNVGGDPVEAAHTARKDHGITIHTLAYGNADQDMLQDIAAAGGGTARSAGNQSQVANEPNPHEIKTDISRISRNMAGMKRVYETLEALPPDVGVNVLQVEKTFYVPDTSSVVEHVWLGNRFQLGFPDDCGFDRLSFELESPSGVITPSAGVDDTVDGEYATARVDAPEPGTWIARVDTSSLVCPSFHGLQLAWQGYIQHPDIYGGVVADPPRAPPDSPVLILASMHNGNIATDIQAESTVLNLGQQWLVPLSDDGTGGDRTAADGTYSGIFNAASVPMNPGAYRVTVEFNATAGVATHAATGIMPEPGDTDMPPPSPAPRTATVLAEGMFRLSPRYSFDALGEVSGGTVVPAFTSLEQGQSYIRLQVDVQDIPLIQDFVRIGLGDGVDISNVQVDYTYPDTAGIIYVDADVAANAPCGPRAVAVQFRGELARSDPGAFVLNSAPASPGDIDGDGALTLADIDVFVSVLIGIDSNGCHLQRADLNSSGTVDGGDIQVFVTVHVGP